MDESEPEVGTARGGHALREGVSIVWPVSGQPAGPRWPALVLVIKKKNTI